MLLIATSTEEKQAISENLWHGKRIFLATDIELGRYTIIHPSKILAAGINPIDGYKVIGNKFLGYIIFIGYLLFDIDQLTSKSIYTTDLE